VPTSVAKPVVSAPTPVVGQTGAPVGSVQPLPVPPVPPTSGAS
jgi:hypothetical protein